MVRRYGLGSPVCAFVIVVALAVVAAGCVPPTTPVGRPDPGASDWPTTRPSASSTGPDGRMALADGPLPWPFEANGGQGPADAPLLLRHEPFTAAFTATGPRLAVVGADGDGSSTPSASTGSRPRRASEAERPALRTARVELELVGARPTEPVGTVPAKARISYLKGDLWAPDLPSYAQIAYREPWPGVELRYERDARGLKSTYLVAPGADPSLILLAWRGADAVHVAEDGALEVATGAGALRETAPVAWQDGPDGAREPVAARWAELGADADGAPAWGFALGAYDPARPLVIDPLLFGTYLGISEARAVAVDGSGRAVVAGDIGAFTFDFGGAPGFDQTTNGSYDAFVARFNAAGTALEYGTFLGGSGVDAAEGVAVDGSGRAVVVGNTASSSFGFGGAPGFDQSYNNNTDAFAVRLNAAGTALEYGTYLGGGFYDGALGVAVDASNRAVVVGETGSSGASGSAAFGFGGAPGFDQTYDGGTRDGFVVRLNAVGTALEYGTYLGGSDEDLAFGVAIDSGNRAVVVGDTRSSTFAFGAAPGFDQTYDGGLTDGFVVRLNAAGTGLEYGTYLGGSGSNNYVEGLALDGSGRAVVAGYTESADFGFGGAPGFQQAFDAGSASGGGVDGFLLRLNAAGTGIEYGTFLGGSDIDYANDVALDAQGRAVVVGRTNSADFGFGGAPGFDHTFGGFQDNFVVKDGLATGLVCTPRPRVVVSPTVSGGKLVATVRTSATSGGTNSLQQLQFGQFLNARVTMNGAVVASGQTVAVGGAATQATFTVERVTPGQGTTVRFTVVDGCGSWQTFVGGGTGAGF